MQRGGAVTLGVTAATGLARAAARSADETLQVASKLLPNGAPAVSAPGMQLLESLAVGPRAGVAAGAVTGLGMAYGAVFGEDKVDLTASPWWKKLLLKPLTDTYNQGIDFRLGVGEARTEQDWRKAFQKGASTGWTAGATVGRAAGSIQGGITGSLLGLELSGEALALLTGVLESTPLPPLLQKSLPLLVGGTCLFAAQAIGSTVGGAVGNVMGGGIAGLGVGTYAALTHEG